jgi:cyclase
MVISRRDFIKKTGLVTTSGLLLPLNHIFTGIVRDSNFISIRRNVGYYTNRGGTIGWLVNDDAIVVVDSQYADTAASCIKGLSSMSTNSIDALINTHHHGDHTGGNAVFEPLVDMIVAHTNVPDLQRKQAQMRGGDVEIAVADTIFETEWKMEFGNEIIRATHFGRAHTSGDAVISFENANVVHMGDLVFNKVFPFIDRDNGASIENWIILLEKVISSHSSDTVYVFGHSQSPTTLTGNSGDLLQMRNYLEAILNHVSNELQTGASRDEITGLVSLKGFEDYVSFGPRLSLAANLNVAFDELSE